jgi:hypothetical protein
MLSRYHLPQPIRAFASKSDERGICGPCTADVFTPSLRQSLTKAREAPSLEHTYSRLAHDVHTSILDGCPWCLCIGNAVLTCSDLDYWKEQWDGSHSDGDSLMDLAFEGAEGTEEGVDEEAGSDEADDAATSGSSASEKPRPGFHTIDSLDCAVRLDIRVEFLKWRDSQLFNLAKVTAEVITAGRDDCPLMEMVGERAVVMTLEVIGQDAADRVSVFSGNWDAVSAASFDTWAPRAREWIHHCKGHQSCFTSVSSFQPTRLINVRDPQHPRLDLLSAGDFDQSPYVALSYVWGPQQSYVLTQASLSDMRKGLDLGKLPRTLSDAVVASHQLGFAYIWIDALCIIQDSPDDKGRELPRMADTYRESALTIVVANAAAASEGFFRAPEPPRFLVDPFNVEFDSANGDDDSMSLTFAYRAPYKASADPISSRAWTLQERVLSQRLLIFSRTGVMWMCKESFFNPSAAPDAGPPYQTFLRLAPSASDEDKDDVREAWMAIRADYTEMDLTYCTDKLPAISALAAEVAKRTRWTYLAGMWKENLFSELHWKSSKRSPSGGAIILKAPKVRQADYLAPSWSWASTGLGGIVDSEDERGDRDVFHFEILSCHTDNADPSFPYGLVNGGCIEVSGKGVELAWQYEDRPGWDISDISLVETGDAPLIVGDGTLDPLNKPLDPDSKLLCLGMSNLRLGRQRILPVEGLILLPNGSDSSIFRRIGFFRVTAPSVFDGIATRTLKIE